MLLVREMKGGREADKTETMNNKNSDGYVLQHSTAQRG